MKPHEERQAAWQTIADRVQTYLDPQDPLVLPQPWPVNNEHHGASHLAARIDLAGGWTDTPPICFDAPAAVFNIAVRLRRARPIGAEVTLPMNPALSSVLKGPVRRQPNRLKCTHSKA